MKSGSIILIVILALLAIVGFKACNTKNSLVGLDENVKGKWANVQTQYQRRADLIPNLVNTVKGAANFEQKTLTDVMNARANATRVNIDPSKLTPESIQAYQQAQGQLGSALGRLLAVSERYPELKANQNFQDLQKQLEGTENRISVARMDFNNAVQEYNVNVRTFPNSVFSGMFGFQPKGMFEADANAQKAPSVQF